MKRFALLALLTALPALAQQNFVVVFADDLGYGDIGAFGHPTIATPNLDRMAAEGQKWTQFYAADNVCTPSRAGLLTGRYLRFGDDIPLANLFATLVGRFDAEAEAPSFADSTAELSGVLA
jgi:hypothetical protein